VQRDADGVDELVQPVEAAVLPELHARHQVGRVQHAVVERPVVQQSKLEALSTRNLASFLGLSLLVESGDVGLVALAQAVQALLRYLLLQEHASEAEDGEPEVVVGGLVEVAHQAVGRVRAGLSEEVVAVVVVDRPVVQLPLFPQPSLRLPLLLPLRSVVVVLVIGVQLVLVELADLLVDFHGGAIIELTVAVVDDLHPRALDVHVVDGLVDVEEEDFGLSAGDDRSLGEVDDAAAVDHEEQLHLLVGQRLSYLVGELSVLGDWVDLVLDVFAFEEFLYGMAGTDSILRVQSESMSTPQKMTMDT
jgi:hypothetical protein